VNYSREAPSKVTIIRYEKKHLEQLMTYTLADEQRRYTAMPLDALKKCEEENDRHPILIMLHESCAGFFVLHGGEGARNYSDNPSAILLRAYSVASDYQGRGIASTSLKLLPSFVKHHFQDKDEMILAVNVANLPARSLYNKCGFIDTGRRMIGKKGELIIMQYQLNVHNNPTSAI
jgi:GNAT superfamily N-acetyltransferase